MFPRSGRNGSTSRVVQQRIKAAVAVAIAVQCVVAAAWACETPVYRYAMYRWQPAPYEIYAFHDDNRDGNSSAVAESLRAIAASRTGDANLAYRNIDLTDESQWFAVRSEIRQALVPGGELINPNQLPDYVIATPFGAILHQGTLDSNAVRRLVESPARRSLADQLSAGKVGVLLFLPGEDPAESGAARELLLSVQRDIEQGRVQLHAAPSQGFGESFGELGEPLLPATGAATNLPPSLGFVEIDRNDAEEKWFVQSLLAIEPDLPAERQPMVFLAYGRGRALLPYIGPGITRQNMLREVEFVSGACSCTVKEQNPGVDLLVKHDWESAAAGLAAKVGAEEGNELSSGTETFFPELFIPSAPDSSAVADNQETAESQVAAAARPSPETEDNSSSGNEPAEEPTRSEQVVESKSSASVPLGIASRATKSSPPPNRPGTTSMLVVAGGLATAVLALFAVTLVVLRPR